ncbi:hypothetical protein [Candidatus Parabeggiatoa sp. HSG14]|uniref:hypothetical protein n=1 Tax=Candidatus Parabeggiatoa sp. HSG14 TaxID=3055593 RepID=UPI0025A7E7DD|nr:hypothetical protein [Thiotrichales bacterium HSG14]
MLMTLNIPEDLATRLKPLENKIPLLLELGLQEFNATAISGFKGAAEILEFFAKQPAPEEIMVLQPSKTLQTKINTLLEKNRHEGLSSVEEQQWEQYQYLEHLVRIAKAKAYLKLNQS